MINRFVSQLFSNINKKKIRYAILRNYESMPNKPKNRNYFDLDIIVSKKDLKKFQDLLIKNVLKDTKLIMIKSFKEAMFIIIGLPKLMVINLIVSKLMCTSKVKDFGDFTICLKMKFK